MKSFYRNDSGYGLFETDTKKCLTGLTFADQTWLMFREQELNNGAKPTRVYKTNRLKSDFIDW